MTAPLVSQVFPDVSLCFFGDCVYIKHTYFLFRVSDIMPYILSSPAFVSGTPVYYEFEFILGFDQAQ